MKHKMIFEWKQNGPYHIAILFQNKNADNLWSRAVGFYGNKNQQNMMCTMLNSRMDASFGVLAFISLWVRETFCPPISYKIYRKNKRLLRIELGNLLG